MNLAEDLGLDELVASVIETADLPPHLGPRDLLDADVIPPPPIARKVYALRALVRSGGDDTPLTGRIADSRDVARYFVSLLRADRTESLWIVGCDARNQVRFHRQVSRGGVTGCSVGMADILRPAVLNACASVVLVHPHPSGDPTPSAEDVELTKRVGDAAELLGIRLLDHVIIGAGRHFSFVDAGLSLGGSR